MRSLSNPVSLPNYIVCALLYASYALLRILKSSINVFSGETEEVKSSLFLAIGLMKSLSIDNNDMCSKSCMYLTQLWNSSRAFKKADGSDMLDLRARSRLNGSHVVDAILWWREEFDPHLKVQMQNLKHSALGECYMHDSRIAQC
jgi:predicted ATPase